MLSQPPKWLKLMTNDGTSFRSAAVVKDFGENTWEVAERHCLQQTTEVDYMQVNGYVKE